MVFTDGVDVPSAVAQNLTLPNFCKFDDTIGDMRAGELVYQSCCDVVVDSVYTNWTINQNSLSLYLEILKSRECSQFEQECRRRTFGFTNFTELVYLRYCNSSELQRRCINDVRNIVEQNVDTRFPSWDILLQHLDPTVLSADELIRPCIQVAMLDQVSTSRGNFFEMTALAPFCDVIACGFDKRVFVARDVSLWTCIPTE